MTNKIVDSTYSGASACSPRTTYWTLTGTSTWFPNNVYLEQYTDGYRIESQMTPATESGTFTNILTGACAEYIEYIDGYADYKNGAICHAVVTDTSD